jgi:hypothetical protein
MSPLPNTSSISGTFKTDIWKNGASIYHLATECRNGPSFSGSLFCLAAFESETPYEDSMIVSISEPRGFGRAVVYCAQVHIDPEHANDKSISTLAF